jgi:enoyl-CoA hydratase/carnithine racemase
MKKISTAVICERKGKIVTITLNLTDTLNRIDAESFQDLRRAVMDFRDDPGAWTAIITGTGKVFSTGADHKSLLIPWANKPFHEPPMITRGLTIWKHLLAAINGPARGRRP